MKLHITCITETREIAEPVRKGGLDNLVFGLAEYAEGAAVRAFNTCQKRALEIKRQEN
jgi:hypothetical protein